MGEPVQKHVGAKSRSQVRNPLGMLGLFCALTEATLGIVVALGPRPELAVPLVWSVVLFPVLVLGAFFALAWWKPEALYSPHDFESDDSFHKAMQAARAPQQRLSQLKQSIDNEVKDALKDKAFAERVVSAGREGAEDVLAEAADEISRKILRREFLVIEVGHGDVVEWPVEAFRDFQDLLDALWSHMTDLPAYSYGHAWTLKDAETGDRIRHLREMTNSRDETLPDLRPLEAVPIRAGSRLVVSTSRADLDASM